MKKNKTIAIAIALAILSFSFIGLIQYPSQVDISSSFRLIETVMPFPGKTVLVINKYLKISPFERIAQEQVAETQRKLGTNFSGLLFYLLGAVFACTEKSILFIFLLLAAVSIRISKVVKLRFGEHYIPPDVINYRRWRLKFITPMEKCILTRADQYDINPFGRILMGEVCPSGKPTLCYE